MKKNNLYIIIKHGLLKTDYSEKYSIEKQEVKIVIPKMGYDLETSGCVLSASNFTVWMNACLRLSKINVELRKNKQKVKKLTKKFLML